MKLLIVVPALHKGGVERVVSNLSQEWIKNNEVKIIVFDASVLAYPFAGDLIDLKLLFICKNCNFTTIFRKAALQLRQ